MTMPPMPGKPEVVTRTTFYQGEDNQWYWQTKAPNNEVIADGSEGYKALKDCLKGFFLSHGITYESLGVWPQNFGPLTRLPENQFQVNKYLIP